MNEHSSVFNDFTVLIGHCCEQTVTLTNAKNVSIASTTVIELLLSSEDTNMVLHDTHIVFAVHSDLKSLSA